jgi:hypothetical protein
VGAVDWPQVWVLFPTFKRTEVSLRNIESLRRHLGYPNLHWHVCDNGSGETDDGTERQHAEVLTDAIARFYPSVTWHEMPLQHIHGCDFGGSINRGMRLARSSGTEIVLMNCDDFGLAGDLDLRPMVDLLDNYPDVGLVRLGYWVRGYAGICCEYFLPRLGHSYMWMRLVQAWSVDPYLFSMEPHLAHLRFFDAYGYYMRRKYPGATEIQMMETFYRASRGPGIFFPLGRKFVHVPYRHTAPRQRDYAAVAGAAVYESPE